jgi:hypothetical protein
MDWVTFLVLRTIAQKGGTAIAFALGLCVLPTALQIGGDGYATFDDFPLVLHFGNHALQHGGGEAVLCFFVVNEGG